MNLERVLKELLALNQETEWIEYKVNNSNPQEIGEYISALSNSACYHDREKAYLIYGIEDSTYQIVGSEFKPRLEKIGSQELENWLATQLTPAIDFTINEFECDGKHMVMFIIDATRQMPVSFKGKPFIRIGSYKNHSMIIQRGNVKFGTVLINTPSRKQLLLRGLQLIKFCY